MNKQCFELETIEWMFTTVLSSGGLNNLAFIKKFKIYHDMIL